MNPTQPKPNSRYLKFIAAVLFSLYFLNCIRNPEDFHFIAGVNLIIHEAGHFIFIFFGEFIHVLGGSLLQVLMPLVFAGYFFWYRREIFSGSIMLIWLGESITEVARYAADAIVMQLPLLGGDNVIHDWNYLFGALHVLDYTKVLSSVMNVVGILIFLGGVVFAFASIFWKRYEVTV